jgi:hypothetical protein
MSIGPSTTTEGTGTWLEGVADAIARSLAGRVSRRSFVGRVGLGAVAASLGGVGVSLTRAQTAWASYPCPSGCNCLCSTQCGNVFPGNPGGTCPSPTCKCGTWCFQDSVCGSGYRRYDDCCSINWCNANGGCKCVAGRASCCNGKTYPEGCGDANSIIVCRTLQCVPVSNCVRIPSYYCG